MIGFADIDYAGLTDVGIKRSHNQDAYAILPANDEDQWRARGHVFLVADGMGAHAVGELASKLAADSIPHIYSKHSQEGPGPALRKAFVEANLTIHTRGQQNREFQGMGTTGIALVIRPEGVWVGHVGDSRAYRVRDGVIEQLSFDHSLVWELARRHNKNPEDLEGVPSNVIIRSLGPEPLVQVDIEGPHPLEPGDCFVLCSDGLSGPVSDREIGAVIGTLPPDEACRFLIHMANLQGGPDNITAIVVRVGGAPIPGAKRAPLPAIRRRVFPWRRILKSGPWPMVLLVVGIVLAVAAIYLTSHELPGDVPIFILGAVSLIVGLAGVMLQTAREGRKTQPDTEPQELHIYKQVPCRVDKAVVDKLAQAIALLEERMKEKNWQIEDASHHHLEQGQRRLKQGDWADAFNEHCRSLLILMEAIDAQRSKEEKFTPLWDRAPVG